MRRSVIPWWGLIAVVAVILVGVGFLVMAPASPPSQVADTILQVAMPICKRSTFSLTATALYLTMLATHRCLLSRNSLT